MAAAAALPGGGGGVATATVEVGDGAVAVGSLLLAANTVVSARVSAATV